MAKDRTQPYWGLTRNFCLANANLGIPTSDNGEDKSFNDFFGLVGRLVEMHAKFDHPSPVTHKMMLESVRFDMKQEDTTGVSQWSFMSWVSF
jgi:hypothetical protein